jgi:hypothetical protein
MGCARIASGSTDGNRAIYLDRVAAGGLRAHRIGLDGRE